MPEGVVEIAVALLVHKQFIVCVYTSGACGVFM